MGKTSVGQNVCREGREYVVRSPDGCISIAYKCYKDAFEAKRQEVQACVRSLEQQTGLPHAVEFDSNFGYGPTSTSPVFSAVRLQGCFENAHVNGQHFAAHCAQELSRVKGTPFEAKLISSHWFWSNEYTIQKK